MQIKSITILIFIERRVLIRLRISDEINYRQRNVERRAASGLFWIETAVVVFVSGAGLHADMPRQSWIWLILWKPVMVWLHTTYQSMDAILLDKWNESLLILSHRGKIDSVCVISQSCTTAIYWDIHRILWTAEQHFWQRNLIKL